MTYVPAMSKLPQQLGAHSLGNCGVFREQELEEATVTGVLTPQSISLCPYLPAMKSRSPLALGPRLQGVRSDSFI